MTEGRCIPHFRIYRMSAQKDRVLVWSSIRCDAPGNQRTFNTLGLKTSLGRSTRTGSRSSPRVSACLAISVFLGLTTEPFYCGSPVREVHARQLLLRRLG